MTLHLVVVCTEMNLDAFELEFKQYQRFSELSIFGHLNNLTANCFSCWPPSRDSVTMLSLPSPAPYLPIPTLCHGKVRLVSRALPLVSMKNITYHVCNVLYFQGHFPH